MASRFPRRVIVEVAKLINGLLFIIEDEPPGYKAFTGDLELAQDVFAQLESLLNTSDNEQLNGSTESLSGPDRDTLCVVFEGMRDGLLELEAQLNDLSTTGISGPSPEASESDAAQRREALRKRLQFHMSCSQLIVENLSLVQGDHIGRTLALVREAQAEQKQVDAVQGSKKITQENRQTYEESMGKFASRYIGSAAEARVIDGISRAGSKASSTRSRDGLIDRWRRDVHDHGRRPSAEDGQVTRPPIVKTRSHWHRRGRESDGQYLSYSDQMKKLASREGACQATTSATPHPSLAFCWWVLIAGACWMVSICLDIGALAQMQDQAGDEPQNEEAFAVRVVMPLVLLTAGPLGFLAFEAAHQLKPALRDNPSVEKGGNSYRFLGACLVFSVTALLFGVPAVLVGAWDLAHPGNALLLSAGVFLLLSALCTVGAIRESPKRPAPRRRGRKRDEEARRHSLGPEPM